MASMGVKAALTVLFLFIATVEADDGWVTFWRTNFTMKCPQNGTWYNNDKKELQKGETLEDVYGSAKKGRYYCDYNTAKYYFYVKGKACENCFELDASLFLVAIILDLVATVCMMIIIYKCTKNKSTAGPAHPPRAPARSGVRAPADPSSPYQALSPHTRSQGVYSVVNRTG